MLDFLSSTGPVTWVFWVILLALGIFTLRYVRAYRSGGGYKSSGPGQEYKRSGSS